MALAVGSGVHFGAMVFFLSFICVAFAGLGQTNNVHQIGPDHPSPIIMYYLCWWSDSAVEIVYLVKFRFSLFFSLGEPND